MCSSMSKKERISSSDCKDIGIRKQECDEEQIAFDYHYESMGGSRHTGTPRTPTPLGRRTRNRLLQDTL